MDRHLNPSGFSLDAYSFVRGLWVKKPVCLPCPDADQSDSDDYRYDYGSDQADSEYQHDESGFDLWD